MRLKFSWDQFLVVMLYTSSCCRRRDSARVHPDHPPFIANDVSCVQNTKLPEETLEYAIIMWAHLGVQKPRLISLTKLSVSGVIVIYQQVDHLRSDEAILKDSLQKTDSFSDKSARCISHLEVPRLRRRPFQWSIQSQVDVLRIKAQRNMLWSVQTSNSFGDQNDECFFLNEWKKELQHVNMFSIHHQPFLGRICLQL